MNRLKEKFFEDFSSLALKKAGGLFLKKQLAVLSTTIMLGIGNFAAIPTVKAQVTHNSQNIQSGISKANSEIAAARAKLAKLNEQTKRTDQAINDNNEKIANTKKKMESMSAQIEQLQGQIKELQEKIAKRNVVLKERAQSFQESGGTVSYLNVLLGATSFADFIDRVSAVTDLVEADQSLMQEHEADKKAVEEKQASVQKEYASLKEMKTEFEGMKAELAQQKAENDRLKANLKQIVADGLAKKANLEKIKVLAENAAPDSQVNTADQGSSQVAAESGSKSKSKSHSSWIKVAHASTADTSAASGSINDVIRAGYKYIGNSVYVFGGGRTPSDIARGRFDCSGFVHWAFSQAGISVGSSTDSLKYSGRQVSTSQMRPGDLVFFNTYKTDGHVGIYLGGGRFIGSQSSTGVAIANMSSGYWAQHFNGRVVRVVN